MSDSSSRVVVAGSINLDLVVRVERLPGKGETVAGICTETFFGGKGANQAVAARRDGVPVGMLGAVGGDGAGAELLKFLRTEGVDTGGVQTLDGESGSAVITQDGGSGSGGDNTIVVIPGANMELRAGVWLDAVPISAGDVVLAQFETPQEFTRAVFERARAAGALTCLNPSPWQRPAPGLVEMCDYIFLNEVELALMLGGPAAEGAGADGWERYHERIAPLAREVRQRTGAGVICTLGEHGVLGVDGDGGECSVAPRRVELVSTAGAGDCFAGVFAAAVLRGGGFRRALERANAAAALSVSRAGVGQSMPGGAEIDAAL